MPAESDAGAAGFHADGCVTRSRSRKIFVFLTAGVAALGGLLFGYDTGVISAALPFISDQYDFSAFQQGTVVSSLLVGAMGGAWSAGRLSDRIGRRRTIMLTAGVFAAGGFAVAAAPGYLALIASRVVIGLAVGSASVLVPLFIAEVAPPAHRGRLVATNQLLITVGILVSYLIGYAFSYTGGWRWMFILAVIPAMALGLGMKWLPESPRWLVAHHREDEARAVLRRIREPSLVRTELTHIQHTRELDHQHGRLGIHRLLKAKVRPLLLVGAGLNMLGQACGINAVIYYAPTILHGAGLGTSASVLATVGIGTVNVTLTIVGMALIDRQGRRPLLLSGLLVMFTTLALLGSLLNLASLNGSVGWIASACLAVYIGAFAVSVGVTVFVIPSEIYPLHVRGDAMGMTLLGNWLINFLVALTLPMLLAALGSGPTFWMFAGICACTWIFVFYRVPETRNRSLEEIEAEASRPGGLRVRRT